VLLEDSFYNGTHTTLLTLENEVDGEAFLQVTDKQINSNYKTLNSKMKHIS